MIIFDTNALRGLHRRNPKFDLLRALKHSGTQAAGIPWMVREELVAQQVLEYIAAYDSAKAALNELNRKTPWRSVAHIPPNEIEKAKEYWRGQYEEVLSTLETSGEDARLALAREAYCEKPAKIDPKAKGGARDVAIWLSVISYLKENPDESVYFVSGNVHDFSDGTSYPVPMSADLGDMKDRLILLTSFEEVISRFTREIDIDIKRIGRLLISLAPDAVATIGSSAVASLKDGQFEGTRTDNGSFESYRWEKWLFPPFVSLREVTNASGHRIDDNEWYTATVNWILIGVVQPAAFSYAASMSKRDVALMPHVSCQWRTKILFSTDEEQAPTIVDAEYPRVLDPKDQAELQPLIDHAAAVYETQASLLLRLFMTDVIRASHAPHWTSWAPNVDANLAT